jgi:hypothetical protein
MSIKQAAYELCLLTWHWRVKTSDWGSKLNGSDAELKEIENRRRRGLKEFF